MNNRKWWINFLEFFRLILIVCTGIGLSFGGIFIPSASASQLQKETLELHRLSGMLGSGDSPDIYGNYQGTFDTAGGPHVRRPNEAPRFSELASADGHWDDVYGLSGMNNRVFSLATDGSGNVYAGGDFIVAGNTPANRIAKWDGADWQALGDGANGRVNSLAVDTNDNVYMGGEFTEAGGVSAYRIAKWDGIVWSALSTGMNNSVLAIVLDGNGNMYAGGTFSQAGGVTANRIAMWDGSTWSPLGTGMNGTVHALALDSNGTLYAGGEFTTAGGNSVNYIARWNGSDWSSLGGGMSSFVYTLGVDPGDDLFAGGNFLTAGGVNVNYIARWDGNNWNSLGTGMNGRVFDLEVDGSGQLYGVGQFTTAGGAGANYAAMWDGSTWSPLGGGLNNLARAATLGSGGMFYVGGDFLSAGASAAYRVAAWDGLGWSKMGDGKGLDTSVYSFAVAGNNEFYVGGNFLVAGDLTVNRIAYWDGNSWSSLWGGMNNIVQTLVYDSNNGDLFAGGNFTLVGGLNVNRIARWNGSAWFNLGTGMNNQVKALALDGNGNLFAGGYFTTAGGITVNYVAKWDGASWSALGSGMDSHVNALAIDGNGNLYAGGNFTTAGGVSANRVAMWDGSTWSALGTGMNNVVNALAVDSDNNLFAGGSFTTADGVTANRIAMWDGAVWSQPGEGLNNTVMALHAVQGGYLYAGGAFNMSGTTSVNRIALWNGSTWSPLGSGLNTTVSALEADEGGNLFVGGDFTYAGGKPSLYIARWFNNPPVANDDGFTMLEDSFLNVEAPGVLSNDGDINEDQLVPNLEEAPYEGWLDLLTDGSFVYTPTVNYNGLITFTYSITDGFGGADTARVAISVTAVNDPPAAEDDVANIDEDTPESIPVLSNDMDVDGDVLYVEAIGLPAYGTAVISDTTHVFYTPGLNYFGTDVFTYTMSDGVITDSATITVTVAPVNDAPSAQDDSFETNEDMPLTVPIPGVLVNDVDAENQPLTAVLESPPSNGDFTFNSEGGFVYTPTLNYHGVDSFTYHATDGITNSNTATVNLIVTSVNDRPQAEDDYFSTDEDVPLNVDTPGVLGNDTDVDGDDLIAALFSGPLHGVLTLYQDGSFQYSPQENYYGMDVFTYTVTDVNSGTHSAQAYITIGSVNDIPLVDAGDDQTVSEGQIAYFSGTFLDPGVLSYPSAGESIRWDFGDGTIITDVLEYSHAYAENGTYTVTLTVTDTEGGTGQDALLVTVENEAPMLEDYRDRWSYVGEPLTVTMSFTDPGLLDVHMVLIQWGDGISQSLELGTEMWEFTASHIYPDSGLYTAFVSVWDDDGGVDQISIKVNVLLPGQRLFLPIVSRR